METKMSAAKVKMRQKKMRNQPASVQYPSSPVDAESSAPMTGGDSAVTGEAAGSKDPSAVHPNIKRPKNPHPRGGWVRGHQRDGGGYTKEMPKYITAGAFARARAAEVSTMLKAVTKTTGSCHVFGALPKHMRRRSMSHNTKRLPCRLRELANRLREKSLQAGSKKKKKKKKEEAKGRSRKARRQHGNLLLEFNRRQRKNIWLETHIWHAKRFHMVKRWGYCLGLRPTYKCYRPSYRAMSSHCLLQDLSYYCCIELLGEEVELLASLSQLTSKEAGPTFAAALCLSGQRQGSVVVYRAGQYPTQPLGPVTFLWRPRTEGSTHRQLWIWAHPTIKQDLLPELQTVCQCCEAVLPPVPPAEVVPVPESQSEPEKTPKAKQMTGTKRKRTCKNHSEPPAKKTLGDGTRSPNTPVTWKSLSNGIVISDLTMEIVRYRLIGPQSHLVLVETMEAATYCNEINKSQPSPLWWPEQCKDERKMNLHRQQAAVFHLLKGIYSTGELPPGTVLGLTVDDPRLTLPTKKVKALTCIKQAQDVGEGEEKRELMLRGVPTPCCQSGLWERSVRDNVTDNKLSQKELNRMKSEVLVPGSRLSPTPLQGRVPLLLVHQPGKQVGHEMSCWGAGWDLLLPKGWGMAFWVPLVYRGVCIGGLTMSLKHSENKGTAHFPHDYPDCPAGNRFQEEQEAQLFSKFKRYPPAKRPNYIKHGCLAPFCCPWQQLAEEWDLILSEGEKKEGGRQTQITTQADAEMMEERQSGDIAVTKPLRRVTVLRNRKSLRVLSGWCRPTTYKRQRARSAWSPLDLSAMMQFLSAHGTSLVWVRLSLLSKGKPELHAMVCAPTAEDLKLLGKEPGAFGPVEPPHREHPKRRTRLQQKRPRTAAASEKTEVKESDPTPEPKPFGLWADPLPSITSHCSRVTLGWVTHGDFSLCAGCGEALGFVTVAGLLHTLLNQPMEHRGTLLLRNPASMHYRFAKVNLEV